MKCPHYIFANPDQFEDVADFDLVTMECDVLKRSVALWVQDAMGGR